MGTCKYAPGGWCDDGTCVSNGYCKFAVREQLPSNELVEELRKASVAIFACIDGPAAQSISQLFIRAFEALERATVEPKVIPMRARELIFGFDVLTWAQVKELRDLLGATVPPKADIEAMLDSFVWEVRRDNDIGDQYTRQEVKNARAELLAAIRAAEPPSPEYKFSVGDSVTWPGMKGESKLTVIKRAVMYKLAWDGHPLDMMVEDKEIFPYSVSTKGIAP